MRVHPALTKGEKEKGTIIMITGRRKGILFIPYSIVLFRS
jgi:hypothetical protein